MKKSRLRIRVALILVFALVFGLIPPVGVQASIDVSNSLMDGFLPTDDEIDDDNYKELASNQESVKFEVYSDNDSVKSYKVRNNMTVEKGASIHYKVTWNNLSYDDPVIAIQVYEMDNNSNIWWAHLVKEMNGPRNTNGYVEGEYMETERNVIRMSAVVYPKSVEGGFVTKSTQSNTTEIQLVNKSVSTPTPKQTTLPTKTPLATPTATPLATPTATPSASPKSGNAPTSAVLNGWSDADGTLYEYEKEQYRTSPVFITSVDDSAYVKVVFDSSISSEMAKTFQYKWYKKIGETSYKHVTTLDNYSSIQFTDPTLESSVSYYCEVSAADGSWTKRTDVFTIKRAYKFVFIMDNGDNLFGYKAYDVPYVFPYGPNGKEDTKFAGWKYNGKLYKPGDTFTENIEGAAFTAAWLSQEATNLKIAWKNQGGKCVAGSDRYLKVLLDGKYLDFSKETLTDNGIEADWNEKGVKLYENGKVHFGNKCGHYWIALWCPESENDQGDSAYLEYDVVPGKVKASTIKKKCKKNALGYKYTVTFGSAPGATKYLVSCKRKVVFTLTKPIKQIKIVPKASTGDGKTTIKKY